MARESSLGNQSPGSGSSLSLNSNLDSDSDNNGSIGFCLRALCYQVIMYGLRVDNRAGLGLRWRPDRQEIQAAFVVHAWGLFRRIQGEHKQVISFCWKSLSCETIGGSRIETQPSLITAPWGEARSHARSGWKLWSVLDCWPGSPRMGFSVQNTYIIQDIPSGSTHSLCWLWTWGPVLDGFPWTWRNQGLCTGPLGRTWLPCNGDRGERILNHS